MALPVLAGLTACSDDHAEYNPAASVNNAQVFFSQQTLNTTTRELDMNAGSFDIEIHRVDTVGELTVMLENHQNPTSTTQLNVPAQVTFAPGQETALITITYDPTNIEFDDINKDTLYIASQEYTSPYGGSEYRFDALIPMPWTDWAATEAAFKADGGQGSFVLGTAGTGTYTFACMGDYETAGHKVYMRQNKLNTNEVQFLIAQWGIEWFSDNGTDLILNGVWDANNEIYRIDVPETYTGYDHSSYGPVYTADLVTYGALRTSLGATGWDVTWEKYPSYYDPQTGKFSLYMVDYVYTNAEKTGAGHFGYEYEYFQVDGFYIPDYSAVPTYQGILTDKNGTPHAQVGVVFGPDVQKALAYVVEADADANAVADALASGEVEGIELVDGLNNIPLGELTGELQVVVASILDGEVKYTNAVKFEYYGGGKTPWKSLGTGLWTEPLISDLYSNIEAQEIEVEIRESEEKPGLYRIMDPYGAKWYLAEANKLTPCSYIEVNAEDANGVYILPQQIGVDIDDEEFALGFASVGGFYYSNGNELSVLKQYGYLGTVQNGIIQLPTFKISDLNQNVEAGSEGDADVQCIFYSNGNPYGYAVTQFKVVLPNAVSNAAHAKAKANAFARRLGIRSVGNFKAQKHTEVKRYAPRVMPSKVFSKMK